KQACSTGSRFISNRPLQRANVRPVTIPICNSRCSSATCCASANAADARLPERVMPAPSLDYHAAWALASAMVVAFALYGTRRFAGGAVDYERVQAQGGTIFLGKGIMNAGYWLLQ